MLQKYRERMLSHFIILRNIMKYNRWSEWWHLDLLKVSEEILSECPRNGCTLNCVPATGKLSCSCYCWNDRMIWGWSPRRNELKIWNPPLLTKHSKTHKSYLKWLTPENHPLEDLCYLPRICTDTEGNPPKDCLKLCQNPPIGKG